MSPLTSWAPLPLKSDSEIGLPHPYAWTVYDPVHDVLVNLGLNSR
jgi:hypothetical protein